MRRSARLTATAGAAVLGVGVAIAAASGDGGVKACAAKAGGAISATDAKGHCGPAEIAITISGEAFKRSKGGTLTINGTAFKAGKGKTITINGTAFRGGKNQTLTINGTAFKGGKNQTLTINGIPFDSSAAAAGPTGPAGPAGTDGKPGADGRIGPTGPPGIPNGPPPVEAATPVAVHAGANPAALATVSYSVADGKAHRLLLTGGTNAVCDPCAADAAKGAALGLTITRDGGAPLVARVLPRMSTNGIPENGGEVSEIVVTPTVCNPCSFALNARVGAAQQVPDSTGGTTDQVVTFKDTRLGIVDLGPVTP